MSTCMRVVFSLVSLVDFDEACNRSLYVARRNTFTLAITRFKANRIFTLSPLLSTPNYSDAPAARVTPNG